MNLYYAESVLNFAQEHIIHDSMKEAIRVFEDKFDCEPDMIKLKIHNISKEETKKFNII